VDDARIQATQALQHPMTASETEVLAALAALRSGQVVATDADNTLWAGDVGDELVRRAATPPCAPWQAGDADLPWYAAEMERDYPRACRYAAEVLLRTDEHAARPPIEQAIRERVRPRRWLIEGLQAAMARGVQVVLVSASPRLTVEIGAELFGLQDCPILAVECLGLEPAVFAEPVPIGQGKVEAWQASGRGIPDLALGDSVWDGPLLRSARLGLLVQRACDDPRCDSPAR
jgi:phosphoserine phosphatase